ncbi:MAG: hypothetical protein IMZ62_15855 [Chloroflexi bacterium]|nr:hypothetical protein [Chloroflexota bacterium]
MIAELGQAAQTASASGITGTFVLDGALLIAGLKLVELGINKVKSMSGNGTKPGTGEECLKHRDKLMELETKQNDMKEDIVEVKVDVKELLRRIPPK